MISFKAVIAAGILAASTTAAFAQEGNMQRYPMQSGYDTMYEGRNAEIAPPASTETNIDKFDNRMMNRGPNPRTTQYEQRLTNESARQRGTERYTR